METSVSSSIPWNPTSKKMFLRSLTELHLKCPRSLRISGPVMPSEPFLSLAMELPRDCVFFSLLAPHHLASAKWQEKGDWLIKTLLLKPTAHSPSSLPVEWFLLKLSWRFTVLLRAQWKINLCILVWNMLLHIPCGHPCIDRSASPVYFCTHL